MNYTQQALENGPTVDDPTGADRNTDIVLGAAGERSRYEVELSLPASAREADP